MLIIKIVFLQKCHNKCNKNKAINIVSSNDMFLLFLSKLKN